MNFGKTSSTLSSPTAEPKDYQLRQSKSKFSRTKDSQKLEKKKVDLKLKEEERICFISPYKLKVTSHFGRDMQNAPNTQTICNPQFMQQQSIIHTNRCDELHQISKMDDSLFSIYDELASENERKRQADIFLLRKQLQNMKVIAEEERLEKNLALEKLKEMEYLQNFLMERQTYICSITEKNIILNQKIQRTEQQRQSMQKELVYLRNCYQLNLKRYQEEISEFKNKCQALAQQNKALSQSNDHLRLQIQDLLNQNNQSSTLLQSYATESQHRVEKNNDSQTQIGNHIQLQSRFCVSLSKSGQQHHQQNKIKYSLTYREADPLTVQRVIEKLEDHEIDTNCDKGCCDIVTKLSEKLRYNQIQINLLKRIKGGKGNIESENQKLQKQIKNLTQRIQYLSQNKKQFNKRSGSLLGLSLTPKKQSRTKL